MSATVELPEAVHIDVEAVHIDVTNPNHSASPAAAVSPGGTTIGQNFHRYESAAITATTHEDKTTELPTQPESIHVDVTNPSQHAAPAPAPVPIPTPTPAPALAPAPAPAATTTVATIQNEEKTLPRRLTLSSSHQVLTTTTPTKSVCNTIMYSPCRCIVYLHKTKTNSPMIEICLYVVFLASLVLYSVDLNENSEAYWFTSRVEETLAREEWGVPVKTFMDVGERGEWWEFMQGKFLETIYDNNAPTLIEQSKQKRAKIWDGNFVFQSIRFNQVRVKSHQLHTDSCKVPDWLMTSDGDLTSAIHERGCLPPYSDNDQSIVHFKPTNTSSKGVNSDIQECFQYSATDKNAQTWPYDGKIYSHYYPMHGHGCQLQFTKSSSSESNIDGAKKWMNDLFISNWFDSATRLIVVDFTLYSADVNMFVFARLVTEQASTGGLVTYFDAGGVKLSTFMFADKFALKIFFRVFLGLNWTIFFIQEIYEWFKFGTKKYCKDPWNVLEFANLVGFLVYAFMLIAGEIELSVQKAKGEDANIVGVCSWFNFSKQLLSGNVVLSVFKVFKYIKVDKRMSLIMVTFYKARMALLSMFIVLSVFLTGFALSFTLGFGTRISGFRNFRKSFITLGNALFGEFPHVEEINQVNSMLGPLLVFLFQGFVNFCLVSLMIAIIEEAFHSAQEELYAEDGDRDVLINNLRKQIFNVKDGFGKTGKNLWSKISKVRRNSKSESKSEIRHLRHLGEDDERKEAKEIDDSHNDVTNVGPKRLSHKVSESKTKHSSFSGPVTTTRRESKHLSVNSQFKMYLKESDGRINTVNTRIDSLEAKLDHILAALNGGTQKTVAV